MANPQAVAVLLQTCADRNPSKWISASYQNGAFYNDLSSADLSNKVFQTRVYSAERRAADREEITDLTNYSGELYSDNMVAGEYLFHRNNFSDALFNDSAFYVTCFAECNFTRLTALNTLFHSCAFGEDC